MKTFTPPNKTFSFEYPDDWKIKWEYENTIMVWRKGGLLKKDSDMTLRITPMIIQPAEKFSAKDYIKEKSKEHKAKHYERNGFYSYSYREIIENPKSSKVPLVMDYWEIATKNRVFVCSFTMTKGQENSSQAKEEKSIAEKILYSIKIL